MHNLVDLSDLYFSEEDIAKMWVARQGGTLSSSFPYPPSSYLQQI